ncbi:hypothetical protein Salat_2767800 [Sesamum alatum]|uniref:Uncharacterized protein n=1 Tax=Sesamum alatum TaxID=300844 RepID=A0AAE2C936_9LAMI|nr:hypothetical protein Salat_2767800 [Sesamum alatum]
MIEAPKSPKSKALKSKRKKSPKNPYTRLQTGARKRRQKTAYSSGDLEQYGGDKAREACGYASPTISPESDSITLSMHYNGLARHVPEAMYEGGSVTKYDYVLAQEINIETLNLFSDRLGLGKDRRFYVIVNRGFKLLVDNKDMKREWRKIKKNREMFIYVEVEGDEGLVRNEMDEVGEGEAFTFLGAVGGESLQGGEGGKEGECAAEGESLQGAEGGECAVGGESLQGAEGDDLHDSDFEGEELHEGGEGDEGGEGVEGEIARDSMDSDESSQQIGEEGHEARHADEPINPTQDKRAGKRMAIETEEEQESETEALEQAALIGTQLPNIFPPLQVDIEEEQPEACLTQDQLQPQAAPPPPLYMPGPSMFHQLQMTHPQSSLQPRVTIRAPPPFRGRQVLPSFSTRPRNATSHPILKEGGHKFLDLNQMKSLDS